MVTEHRWTGGLQVAGVSGQPSLSPSPLLIRRRVLQRGLGSEQGGNEGRVEARTALLCASNFYLPSTLHHNLSPIAGIATDSFVVCEQLPDEATTGFCLCHLRFIYFDLVFPPTLEVGIRRFGEIAAHLAELFADVALFRRNGQGALYLCHVLNYVNNWRDAMGC